MSDVIDAPASGPRGGRGRGRRAGLLVAAAVLVVAVGAGAWWLVTRDDSGPSGVEAAQAFVEDYTRHVDATFLVEGELTRTLADGRSISSAYLVVQRPPDRIQRSLGSTTGEIGDRTINCATPPGGEYDCAASGEAPPWEERRATILDAVDSYVLGDHPAYAVTVDGDGCYSLVAVRDDVEATFGRRARLCFDDRYGALRRLEVERQGGSVDVMLASRITDQVSGADFDVQRDDTYDPEVPDDAGTVPPSTSQEPPP